MSFWIDVILSAPSPLLELESESESGCLIHATRSQIFSRCGAISIKSDQFIVFRLGVSNFIMIRIRMFSIIVGARTNKPKQNK